MNTNMPCMVVYGDTCIGKYTSTDVIYKFVGFCQHFAIKYGQIKSDGATQGLGWNNKCLNAHHLVYSNGTFFHSCRLLYLRCLYIWKRNKCPASFVGLLECKWILSWQGGWRSFVIITCAQMIGRHKLVEIFQFDVDLLICGWKKQTK